jgi:sugar phosphate isomerase/epimerase
MGSARDFGVQSFCFRNFKDNAEVARMVRDLGLDKIEICAVHADFNDVEGWKKTVETYAREGVEIVSIGVQTFNGEDSERDWFECAKAAGAKYISAHFKVGTFQQAVPATVKLCEEYGVKLGIHCHGGYMFGGSPDVIEHLMALGGPAIGLNLDTAWCMQIGPRRGDPVEWVRKFADRLYGLHYKDFTFAPDGSWTDVVVGTGNLDLPALVAAVDEVGFDGYAVIEYEGDVENPVPALAKCVEAMRSTMG